MKKTLVLITLVLALSSLWAGGVYATGPSVTMDTASKIGQAGFYFINDNLVVEREEESWINPLLSNHFDIVFSGLFKEEGLEQMAFSYIGSAGASFKPNQNLYINLSLGPSVFTTFGTHNGTFGVGLGGALSFSYAFSNPGFVINAGVQSSYTLLFDSSNPMMIGAYLGVGYKL